MCYQGSAPTQALSWRRGHMVPWPCRGHMVPWSCRGHMVPWPCRGHMVPWPCRWPLVLHGRRVRVLCLSSFLSSFPSYPVSAMSILCKSCPSCVCVCHVHQPAHHILSRAHHFRRLWVCMCASSAGSAACRATKCGNTILAG